MKNKYIFITVGIITKNEEKHIVNTLKYLINQTYSKNFFEIVIADGNSSDNTVKFANDFLEQSGISFKIINEKSIKNKKGVNYGHSWARNVVIMNSSEKSKYIAWIDADCRADKDWLMNLYKSIKNTPVNIIGAGGPRYVETNGNISKKELMLNYYFTSFIMSLGNPAFCKRKVKFMPSIAGYNSIYKKEIFDKYIYDTTYPFNTDDLEINFRLLQNGFKFIFVENAIIYHRIEDSIIVFLKSLINYGLGAGNTMKLHKKIPRIYIPIAFSYFLYTIFLPILIIISGMFFKNYVIPIYPFALVFILSVAVFIENIMKIKSLYSLYVFVLVPLHLFLYGYGFFKSLLKN